MSDVNANLPQLAIEKHLCKKTRQFIRFLFIIDVINCTAFYYKICQSLFESLVFENHVEVKYRTGTTVIACTLTTVFLIGMEYGQKYWLKSHRSSQKLITSINMSRVQAGVILLDQSNSHRIQPEKDKRINLEAVEREMNNYNRKRPVLLLLFMLLLFSTITVSYDTVSSEELKIIFNASTQCSGLSQPIAFANFDTRIFSATAIVIFALKNYTLMLPVCVEELKYPKKEFTTLVFWSEATLVLIYTLFAMSVYMTFGESVSPLFLTSYGKNIVGFPLVCIALAMTLNAMLLRIIGCIKLIQVLFIDNDTENVFWLVVIFSIFGSLLLALVVKDTVYLVVLAGSVTCNLLCIIFPCISYLKFKKSRREFSFDIVPTFCSLLWHSVLLMSAPFTLYTLDPNIGIGCRKIFNIYWK
ncbi:uncharacterized protein LOC120328287 [Styela clava]